MHTVEFNEVTEKWQIYFYPATEDYLPVHVKDFDTFELAVHYCSILNGSSR